MPIVALAQHGYGGILTVPVIAGRRIRRPFRRRSAPAGVFLEALKPYRQNPARTFQTETLPFSAVGCGVGRNNVGVHPRMLLKYDE